MQVDASPDVGGTNGNFGVAPLLELYGSLLLAVPGTCCNSTRLAFSNEQKQCITFIELGRVKTHPWSQSIHSRGHVFSALPSSIRRIPIRFHFRTFRSKRATQLFNFSLCSSSCAGKTNLQQLWMLAKGKYLGISRQRTAPASLTFTCDQPLQLFLSQPQLQPLNHSAHHKIRQGRDIPEVLYAAHPHNQSQLTVPRFAPRVTPSDSRPSNVLLGLLLFHNTARNQNLSKNLCKLSFTGFSPFHRPFTAK